MPKPSTVQEPAPLLEHLFVCWPDIKRKQIRTWLRFQAITVNGRAVTQFNHALRAGDIVAVRTERFAAPRTVLASGMKVFFEDADLIVIDKPANLLSIASEKEREKTAYFMLTDYLRNGNPRGKERVWIVHRLDRETSGLMVFAKTAEAKDWLQQYWDHFEKGYDAVVEGNLPEREGVFESDLDETNPYRVHSARPSERTRHAVTHYRVIAVKGRRTLVGLRLATGRRHQIRVHLFDAGCPIIGDKKYDAVTNPAGRLGLHASFLRFEHPTTGEEMRFRSPLPRDLGRLV
ncbi:MAG: RluA family pseudouridine synthase [bacterium]|jgi:23S rRNA pseudouridine1911/1915/1917 synthase